jgi:hypothetical protein
MNEWNLKARSGVRRDPIAGKFRTVIMASWVEYELKGSGDEGISK